MRTRNLVVVLALALAAEAQSPLSVKDAVRLALQNNPATRMATAGEDQAKARQSQARAGYLPRVDYIESVDRGNNPVYVFGSLLTQHQFTSGNFDLGLLNRPDALSNFRSAVLVEQSLFDGGRTRLGIKTAEIGQNLAQEQSRRTAADLTLATVETYFGAVLAAASLEAAYQALATAKADLVNAEARRDSGLTTDADVLAFQVHVAEMEERRIRAASQVDVARAALNDVLGKPLDTAWTLPAEVTPGPLPAAALADTLANYEGGATARPEGRQSELGQELASTQRSAARSSYLPQVSFRGGVEADRQTFASRSGSNWMAGLTLRMNVFNGGADRARVAEAEAAVRRSQAEREGVLSSLRLEIRRAWFDLQSAGQRVKVAAAIVDQATESHRIIQNRYQGGLSTATELLRAETALLGARTQRLGALHDQRVAAARLEYAAGRLTPESEVLQ
jgi:outer membrane protein TolC